MRDIIAAGLADLGLLDRGAGAGPAASWRNTAISCWRRTR